MGGSYSCLLCLGDDALGDKKDTGTKHRDAWSWIDDSCLAGCLDDSDVERVFVTEGACAAVAPRDGCFVSQGRLAQYMVRQAWGGLFRVDLLA